MKGKVGRKGDDRYRKPKKGGQLRRRTRKDWRSVSRGLCCSVIPRMSRPAAKKILYKVSVQEMLEKRNVLLLLPQGGKEKGAYKITCLLLGTLESWERAL